MADYNIRHTDKSLPSISVPETEVNDTALDVTLFGRINPEYGERLDQNLLNMLENFACPQMAGSTINTAVPNLNETTNQQLHKPVIGQFWYNSTRKMFYFWNGENWIPTPSRETYAANWGSIMDGQQLPRPVSPISGYTFEYSECIWSVAPAAYLAKPSFVSCGTDENALVTMIYRPSGQSYTVPGLANYLIIGIGANVNRGVYIPPVLPTPTPSPTPSSTPEPSVTPTPSVTATPAVSPPVTPTSTPTPSPVPASPTPQPTPTVTPTISVTPSITPTQSPFPPMSEAPTSIMDGYGEVFWSSIPCPGGGQSGQASTGGYINVSGGSGSFTYVWTFTPDPLSNFAVTTGSSGNTWSATGPFRSCPYQGGAFGGISVLVTDTVTGLQATFTGSYTLEYTG